ncbi:MAG: chromosomal replication initiator protein DnaA [Clostridiales bacterium]|nr:chromosomal replication initiator protein DnaA [Clostridiales bacterium]
MLETLKEKWNDILLYLKEEHEISDVSYKTWLLPLKVYNTNTDGTVQIIVPDANFSGYIKKKYGFLLKIAIEEITGLKCELDFVVADQIKNEADSNGQLIRRQRNAVSQSALQNANLNPKYTFDTFVVGANNNLAHAASLAVAESPGEIYNPLFIYGGVGLGKTHLMHSIANFILKNNPKAKILYVTSEKFTNELIDAIRNKNNFSTTEFREKYRNNDVLLIDDIQFIIGKESTQEEFFHTFNAMYEAKKQIIISSDKPPKEIETLEERLRSRFEWGLTVDIQSPDYETRMAILRKKEELEGYNIDNEVIKYIATNIKSNIRELEGALTKIVALSKLDNNKEINIALAEEALKDIISPGGSHEVTPEKIIQVVSDHFNLTPLDILSQKRTKEIVYPRQIAMYLCRHMTNVPLQEIGRVLGGRDHTTIIHGIDKITLDLQQNPTLQNTIDILMKKINPQ